MRTNFSIVTLITALVALASTVAKAESLLDLTSTGVSQGTINTAIFQRSSVQPTGSGVIDAFLRIDGGNNKPFVQGYNTDARSYNNGGAYQGVNGGSKTQFDEKSDLVHTHSIRSIELDQLSLFNIGSVDYYGFLLDIGQEGISAGETNLSMRAFQLFQSNSNLLDTFVKNPSESLGGSLTGGTQVYDMDGPPQGDYRVDLQANLNPPGNGVGDMEVFVPKALFNQNLTYVYLYSSFGTADKNTPGSPYHNTGSFQEWAMLQGVNGGPGPGPVVPLPPAVWAGLALISAVGLKKRMARNSSDEQLISE